MPILIGKEKAGMVFSVMTGLVYLWIIGAVVAGLTGVVETGMPPYCLIALLTLPLAIKAIQGAMKPQEINKIMPALPKNVAVVLLTQFLLGIGYILAGIF